MLIAMMMFFTIFALIVYDDDNRDGDHNGDNHNYADDEHDAQPDVPNLSLKLCDVSNKSVVFTVMSDQPGIGNIVM